MNDDVFPGDLTGGFTAQEPGLPSPPRFQEPVAAQDEPRRSRRVALLLIATVPWLVLLVLFVRPSRPLTAPAAAVSATDAAPTPPGAAQTPIPTPSPLPATEVHGNTRATTDPAGALAVVVARAHLGTAGPSPQIPGIQPGAAGRYVEHVAVEAIDMPAPGAAVVTVVSVVLTASGDHYDGVEVLRLAVPIVFEGPHPAPGGQPWLLPPPDLTPGTLALTPDQRPELADAATRALTDAGFSAIADLQVATAEGWPVVAEFTGVASGAAQARPHVIWLRRHLDGLAVAGIASQEKS